MRKARLVQAGFAVATTATAMIINAGGAHASTVDGSNPGAGCASGAYTARSAYARLNGRNYALVELRYSPHCRTTWGRITTIGIPPCHTNYDNCGFVTVHRTSDGKAYECIIPNGGHGCYTPQVNDAGVTSYADGYVDAGANSPYARTGTW